MNDRPTLTAQSAFEARLTSAFAAYADRAPVEVDAVTLTAKVTRGGAVRRNPFAGARRYLVPVLLGLLLIALAAAAIGVGSSLLRAPSPSLPRSGYDGIVVRPVSDGALADLDVIAVQADGRERLVRRLTTSDLPGSWSFTGGAKASRDGWIAMSASGKADPSAPGRTQFAYALFDLVDPARPPSMVPSTHTGAWGGDHLFATTVSNIDVIEVVDPDTGARTKVGGLSLPGGGPDIVWTADGSGIVWRRSDGRYAIRPIDGRPPTEVPALAFARGSRYIAAGGASLEYEAGETADAVDAERPAGLVPPGTLWVLDVAGTPTTWYRGELEPARLLDASFSTDGHSVWLLLERIEGTHHVADVAKMAAPGQASVVGSVDLGEGVAWLWFESFAPDDSAIAIGHWTGTLGGTTTPGPTTILWMNGPTTSAHPGDLAGFVPTAVIDAITARSVTASPTATPASPIATPALPADEPCAAMTHLLFPGVPHANSRDPIPAVGPITGNGDVLVRTNTDASGGTGIERFDPSQSPPSPVESSAGGELALPSALVSSGVDRGARMVVSPDGRAVAFEAGDLSPVGCGDPIVVSARDGYRRPFPGRAYELISDLAWAPDGSALYGIRRPTRDARAVAYTKTGPGTVLRWDTATGKMTELPAGCEDCSQLFVSPDGTHIAAEGEGVVRLYDADGGWRRLTSEEGLLGWADDRSIVLRSGRVDLDGGSVVRWEAPQTGPLPARGQILSRDGATIAAVTLSSDLKHEDVTLIDVRGGSTRVIGSLLIGADCEFVGLADRRSCLEHGYAMPGPGTVSEDARVAAWAPDGSAVLILDPNRSETAVTLRVVPVDGSGARAPVAAQVDFPLSVVWLPATAP